MNLLVVATYLCLTKTLGVSSYKILGLCSPITHSHHTLSFRLMKELADRGHKVTFVNNYPQTTPIKNLKEISVKGIGEVLQETYNTIHEFTKITYFKKLEGVLLFGRKHSISFLQHKNVQELMRSDEHFDLIIIHHFFNDALVAFAHKFNAPFIFLTPWELNYFDNYLMTNPLPVSYVTYTDAEFSPKMTFWERIINAFNQKYTEYYIHNKIIPDQNRIAKEMFPNAPDLESILFNASLILVASHVTLSQPIPLQQNVKLIGGYHVKPPKPLPSELQEFMDKSVEGVVVFSMGSILKSNIFKREQIDGILRTFSKIKQKVLWKFDQDVPRKPDNVKILNWIPQSDVLAHPNTVAFISHGGLLGTTEAVYHGVPILGIPVFWDQFKYIGYAISQGTGLKVGFNDFAEDKFSDALLEILNNPKYRKRAKEVSLIMRDQPVNQLDEAVFWIEYVVRHKGAPHLRSFAGKLRWYQLYSLDVILFGIVVFLVINGIMLSTFFCIVKKKPNVGERKKNK